MPSKTKGINAERELIHLFWQTNEWAACRIAGSGSSQYPSADILASNTKRNLAIEAKLTKDSSKYFSYEEIAQLKEFASKFGAEPWIAVKFKGENWKFLCLEDLQQTSNNFAINQDLAKTKGLGFDELIKEI
jgi:Holliday junction resolvase